MIRALILALGLGIAAAGAASAAQVDDFYSTRLKHDLEDAEDAAGRGDFSGMRDALDAAQHDRRMLEFDIDDANSSNGE